jgi:DNA segregation ATPase FtsK/SpoIIIE-like protein
MASKSGVSKKSGAAGRGKAASAKARQTAPEARPSDQRNVLREVLGVFLMGAGALIAYFSFADTSAGAAVLSVLRGLAGSLYLMVPLIVIWAGFLVTFMTKERRIKPGRLVLMLLLALMFAAAWHVFFAHDILGTMRLNNFANFISRSYAHATGGAGVMGALLCWPIYFHLARGSEFGAILILGTLMTADLILLRKISLRRLGGRVRQSYDVYVENARRRADEKRLAAERAAEIPLVSAPPGVRPQRAARTPLPDSDDLETWDVQPGPQGRREMVIERIHPDDPLPGEPRVQPVASEEPVSDVPGFLTRKRPARNAGPEPLRVAEPEPLFKPELPPQPDGSEVAEPDPFTNRGQAEFAGGDWQEIGLGDDPVFSQGEPEQAKAAQNDLAPEEEWAADEPDAQPPFEATNPSKKEKRPVIIAKPVKKAKRADAPPPADAGGEPYNYPPIDLLAPSKPSMVKNRAQTDERKARKLIETLDSFGISARLIGIAHGPTVTRFELSPAAGVKVSRITSLADDIALNLAAVSVRIEAPIPGKAAVGVEVPNETIEVVPLRDVLESSEARKHPSRIAVALGRDNAGRYIISDLAKMPHVLIAGATGSGKSVCINCIICSILYRATPDEVKLIMIDPKVVELSSYNGIPHLLVPVVTDPKKAASALDWAVSEMTSRYKKFAELGVRDMKGYNLRRPEGEPAMPQIVIIIDELADLMMVTPGEVEDSICRLAQLARAAGIHLVIATQRPSVNVITGVIKANIPSRIAFTVASQVDSRTILDMGGAEKLLGRGDMLFAPAGMNKPARVQGAWVADDEVNDIVSYIKVRHETTYDEDVIEHLKNAEMSDAQKDDAREEYDELLPQAVETVIEAGQASTSMLQRRLRVGYARAGRLIDEMEKRGIVGPADGAKPRAVLISREQFKLLFDD